MERELSVLAITDHDEIWGAMELRDIVRADEAFDGLQIIVGEEITTTEGEIIGLFLEEAIPKGVTPNEAVRAIHAQGGLVLLPHGFDPFKRGRLAFAARGEIADAIDIVEVFNRRVSLPRYNRFARTWAEAHDKLLSVGSDAHTLGEVGTAWLDVPERRVDAPSDLLAALPEGSVRGRWRQPILAYLQKLWSRITR